MKFGIYQTRIKKVIEAVCEKELKELSDNINRLQSSFEQLKSFRIPISKKEDADDNNNIG